MVAVIILHNLIYCILLLCPDHIDWFCHIVELWNWDFFYEKVLWPLLQGILDLWIILPSGLYRLNLFWLWAQISILLKDCRHIFLNPWTDQQSSFLLPYMRHSNSKLNGRGMAYICHLSQFGPSNLCKRDPPRWLCRFAFQTFLSFCTITIVSHCVFWGNACQSHDQAHPSYGLLCIHMAI